MSVTIAKIAERAGVSPATVSQVLNGNARRIRITEETANKVIQLAKLMKYEKPLERNSMKATNWLAKELNTFSYWLADSSFRIMPNDGQQRGFYDIDKQEWRELDSVVEQYLRWKGDIKY